MPKPTLSNTSTVEEKSHPVKTTVTTTSSSVCSSPYSEVSHEKNQCMNKRKEHHPHDHQSRVNDSNSNAVDSSEREDRSKKMRRILSNREHARASYLRKKKMIEDLKANVLKYEEENKQLRKENNLLKANQLHLMQKANMSSITAPRMKMPPPQDVNTWSSRLISPSHQSIYSEPVSSVAMSVQRQCHLDSLEALLRSSVDNLPGRSAGHGTRGSSSFAAAAANVDTLEYQRLIGDPFRHSGGQIAPPAIPSHQEMVCRAFGLMNSNPSVSPRTHQIPNGGQGLQMSREEAVRKLNMPSADSKIRRVSGD